MKWACAMAALCSATACGRGGGGGAGLPTAVALSPDGVRHAWQSYSPDGKRMAYWAPATDSSGDWQLWVANADLSGPTKLSVTAAELDGPSSWSPDGTQLAAPSSQHGVLHVVVVSVADGAVKQVTNGHTLEVPGAFFRGGDWLTFSGPVPGGRFRSNMVSLRTGASAPLVPSETRSYFGAPSPDGSHVAYTIIDGGKRTVWVADSAGGDPRQLTTEGFESLEEDNEWSPDGKELLYESTRTGTSDLWIVPIDGGKPRQLTRDVRNDYAGSWSPDGKWIAFLSDRGRQTDVWLVPAAGGTELRVTDDAVEEHPPLTWRPGTHTLAYRVRSELSGVWASDLATGKERRLTPDSVRVGWFNLSPDGRQINYVIRRGGDIEDLAVMPFAGGASRTVISGGGLVDNPWWSPDGTKIVFSSDRGGRSDVWIVDVASGALRQLESSPGREQTAVWSADGSDIYFWSDHESHGDVWKVPASGGEPVRVTPDGSIGAIESRSGSAELFVDRLNPNGHLGPARVRPDGSVQSIWTTSNALLMAISPSRDTIAASVEQPDGTRRTMLLATNGGGGRIILGSGETVQNWSPDGSSLIYSTNVGGARHLGLLRLADGVRRSLTSSPDDEFGAELTPDGKTVVFRRTRIVDRIVSADLSKLIGSK